MSSGPKGGSFLQPRGGAGVPERCVDAGSTKTRQDSNVNVRFSEGVSRTQIQMCCPALSRTNLSLKTGRHRGSTPELTAISSSNREAFYFPRFFVMQINQLFLTNCISGNGSAISAMTNNNKKAAGTRPFGAMTQVWQRLKRGFEEEFQKGKDEFYAVT